MKEPTGVGLHITLGYLCITQLDHSYALYTFVTFLTQVPLEELQFNNVTIIMHGDKCSSTYLLSLQTGGATRRLAGASPSIASGGNCPKLLFE